MVGGGHFGVRVGFSCLTLLRCCFAYTLLSVMVIICNGVLNNVTIVKSVVKCFLPVPVPVPGDKLGDRDRSGMESEGVGCRMREQAAIPSPQSWPLLIVSIYTQRAICVI